MENRQQVLDYIEETTGSANVLAIPRAFIAITGDLKAALFLSQCVYWSDKGGREDGFFWKSAAAWLEETGLSRFEVDGARKLLMEKGLLEAEVHRTNGVPTMHYRVQFDALQIAICDFSDFRKSDKSEKSQMDLRESDKSDLRESDKYLTEITTETTTEITSACKAPKAFCVDAPDGETGSDPEPKEQPETPPIPEKPIEPEDQPKTAPIKGKKAVKPKAEKAAKQPKQPKQPPDPRLAHPALVIYRDEARLHIPVAWRDEACATVADPALWQRVVHEWIGRGWNKQNVQGMLGAYRKGGIEERGTPGASGAGGSGGKPIPTEQELADNRAAAQARMAEIRKKRKEAEHANIAI